MTREFLVPTISPIWERNILSAKDSPLVTNTTSMTSWMKITRHSTTTCRPNAHFFPDHAKMSTLRKSLPPHLRNSTIFEFVTACLWKCRTIALQISDPTLETRMLPAVNARMKYFNLAIPEGYYGNAFVWSAAVTTVGELIRNPISYALELEIRAKESVTKEYLRSMAALMVVKGRPSFTKVRFCLVSDLRHVGFHEVDFGWGKPLYGGIGKASAGPFHGVSFYVSFSNRKGENGIVVPVWLPNSAMVVFEKELDKLVNDM